METGMVSILIPYPMDFVAIEEGVAELLGTSRAEQCQLLEVIKKRWEALG
jgi:hypothetical protein